MSAGIVGLTILVLIKSCVSFDVYSNACEDYSDYVIRYWSRRCYYNPDVLSNTPMMIIRNGFPLESFTITTQDGYILSLFRIPTGNNKSNGTVFLMHAFELVEKGYDVWLGSTRGTKFADSHLRFNTSSKDYWNFNLDSLAYFDVGAQLKFIAQKTKKRITYIGFSTGSTLSLLYSAGYPSESRTLLSGIIAMAPTVYVQDIQLLRHFKEIVAPLERELARLKMYGVFHQHYINKVLVQICATLPHFCKKLLEMFAGKLSTQFLPDELLLFFSNCPSGTSFQVLKHYLQMAESGDVHRYNYGRDNNLKYYHLSEPSKYDMRYVKIPAYVIYGRSDIVATETNVKRLFGELGSTRKRLVGVSDFTHLDFVTAKNVDQQLYSEIFRILQEIY
ncbi:lipase member K-like [Zophobas morio]|uniref:lipase member K-like n=1 Tax=Zophobas morio TaxID=2755281 RepID=UPI0030833209